MSEQRDRVIAVGEAIVELVRGGDGRFGIGCAGDTFNVAVYLARAGINAGFATALGEDPYSEAILALAAAEGVACDLVLRARGRLPGLALVDTDAAGTRQRHDWRIEAPARELFELLTEGLRSSAGDVNEISTSRRRASRLVRMMIDFCGASSSDCSAWTNRFRKRSLLAQNYPQLEVIVVDATEEPDPTLGPGQARPGRRRPGDRRLRLAGDQRQHRGAARAGPE